MKRPFLKFWGPGLAGLLLALGSPAARAQSGAGAARTAPKADTTAAPAVAPAASGAASVPATEFETYAVEGQGVRYTASLTGLYTSGTVARTFLSTSHTANLSFKGGHWLVPGALSFSYGKQDGLQREREFLLLTTPTYQQGRYKFYTLGQVEYSNLRAIDYRVVGGLGGGYQLYRDTLRNEANVSYFLLREDTQYYTDLHRQVLRHSLRAKGQYTRGAATLTAQVYYQPAVGNVNGDYRVNGTGALAVRLSRHLALAVTYAYALESINVEDRAPVNTNLSVGFTYAAGK
ncbi:MAG: DUF481 domain-containing protein [Janthinobacterium lividum]